MVMRKNFYFSFFLFFFFGGDVNVFFSGTENPFFLVDFHLFLIIFYCRLCGNISFLVFRDVKKKKKNFFILTIY